MRKVFLFFCICFLIEGGTVSYLFAQSGRARVEIKNLLRELRTHQDDSTRVTILLQLSEYASGISLDSSAHYAERAFNLANKINHPDLAVKALSLLGDIYRLNNSPEKAAKYYMMAEDKMQGLPFSERDAYTLYYTAEVLKEKGETAGAEKYYLKALDIVNHQEESNTQTVKFIILAGLINLYKSEENYTKALEKYKLIEKVHQNLLEEDFVILNKSEVGALITSIHNDILDAQSKRMRTLTNLLILFGVLVLLVIVITLYILNIRRKKMNTILSIKNHELDMEKRKVDELLLNIFPKEIADELKTLGKSDIKTYERVSVLFTDFKGFTQIAEKMSPQKLIHELNDCFTHFDEIIKKYNLEKIKTIGDAYMCAGGIPVSNLTNPLDIILAGLEIQRFMKKRKEEKMALGEKYWECRLGINTGEVIAGVIGKSKFAYDIWSDTVNTASRTETNGEVYKVNITQRTYHYIKDFFECEYRGKITTKGKGDLDMYFVHNIKAELSEDGKGEEPNAAFYQLRDKTFSEQPESSPKVQAS